MGLGRLGKGRPRLTVVVVLREVLEACSLLADARAIWLVRLATRRSLDAREDGTLRLHHVVQPVRVLRQAAQHDGTVAHLVLGGEATTLDGDSAQRELLFLALEQHVPFEALDRRIVPALDRLGGSLIDGGTALEARDDSSVVHIVARHEVALDNVRLRGVVHLAAPPRLKSPDVTHCWLECRPCLVLGCLSWRRDL